MTNQVAAVLDLDAERRWQKWQADGAESDRRTARRMRTVMLLTAALLAFWLTVVLA